MKKRKIIITVTVLIFISFNFLFGADEITEYDIFWADEKLRWSAEYELGIVDKPVVVNIISTSGFTGFYNVPQFQYYYNFIWNENEVKSTSWVITYTDSVTRTNTLSIAAILPLNSIHTHYVLPFLASVYTIWEHHLFKMDLSFLTNDTLNIDNCAIRFSEFITTIKQDVELFKKLEFASTDTVNQYFAFGIGYIETLGNKDAFTEYDIDKKRPICFVATLSKHENKGDFCYSYADEEITELTCHSNYISVSEPSTVANLQVSPNPTSNSAILTLDLATAGNLTVTVNNLLGQELFEIHSGFADTGTFTKTFSIETLPKGVYYLKITHNGNVTVEKVVRK